MDEAELKELLRVEGRTGVRGWRCPDDHELAAYAAHGVDSATKTTLESHLAGCQFCLSLVSFLVQAGDWDEPNDVPLSILSKARGLVTHKPRVKMTLGWRWAISAVAVGCFALLCALVVLQMRQRQSASPQNSLIAQQTSPPPAASVLGRASQTPLQPTPSVPIPKARSHEAPVVRSNTEAVSPRIITPREGAVLRPDDLEFQWEPVSDAISYEVRVMSSEGNLVLQERTENTRLKPSRNVPLVSGKKYFVVTRAHLPEGRVAKSTIVSFEIADQ